jgi:hypothetical protein
MEAPPGEEFDLFAYTAQLAPANPSTTTHVPFGWQHFREGGPELTVFVDRKEGPAGLLHVFEVCAAMLAAQVATVPDAGRRGRSVSRVGCRYADRATRRRVCGIHPGGQTGRI